MSETLNLSCGRALTLGAADSSMAPLFSDEWLGSSLWPAARAMVELLETEEWRSRLAQSIVVCELGAGTGACGLAAAALGATRIVLTDKPELLPTLRANAAANGLQGAVSCKPLHWAEPLPADLLPQGADLVLAADCLNPVYGESHAPGLAATIERLLARSAARAELGDEARRRAAAPPEGVLAQARRGAGVSERAFFAACARSGLDATLLREVRVGGDDVVVYSLKLAQKPAARGTSDPAG